MTGNSILRPYPTVGSEPDFKKKGGGYSIVSTKGEKSATRHCECGTMNEGLVMQEGSTRDEVQS